MLNLDSIRADVPPLQAYPWPPVDACAELPLALGAFFEQSAAEQRASLAVKRRQPEAHGAFLHDALGVVYGYVYGYEDSPLYLGADDAFEEKLLRAKLVLERELVEYFLMPDPAPALCDAEDACAYLRDFVAANFGVDHSLFDYVAHDASEAALREFLRLEVMRNEVVDDEVAFMVVGLQGAMKKVAVSNLWDECGNGQLDRFHTYWLRRLLDGTRDWSGIREYRRRAAPWFARITSNSLNRTLTRPGLKFQAYGHFLTTEAWVLPHFERILAGLKRVGLADPDVQVYFAAHIRIDPHHTDEMLAGIRNQRPALTRRELAEVALGAHTASAAGVNMYDRVERHLRSIG